MVHCLNVDWLSVHWMDAQSLNILEPSVQKAFIMKAFLYGKIKRQEMIFNLKILRVPRHLAIIEGVTDVDLHSYSVQRLGPIATILKFQINV